MLVAFFVNLVTLIIGLSKGVSALISVRDDVRDMKRALGHEDPPSGLIGDVHELRRSQQWNRDEIITIKAELGHPLRRVTDPH